MSKRINEIFSEQFSWTPLFIITHCLLLTVVTTHVIRQCRPIFAGLVQKSVTGLVDLELSRIVFSTTTTAHLLPGYTKCATELSVRNALHTDVKFEICCPRLTDFGLLRVKSHSFVGPAEVAQTFANRRSRWLFSIWR